MFGLHENTAIGYSARFAKSLWMSLQRLLPETDLVSGIPSGKQMSTFQNQLCDEGDPFSTLGGITLDDNDEEEEEMEDEEEEEIESLTTPQDDTESVRSNYNSF